MNSVLLLFSLAIASGLEDDAIYGEYHLYKNFGPAFYDYGGREYHAINGESFGDDVYPTIPTDRGAYFTGASVILLHNAVWPVPHFSSGWRMTIWLYRIDGTGLMSRKISETGQEVVVLSFVGTTMSCDLTIGADTVTRTSSQSYYVKGNIYLDKWYAFNFGTSDLGTKVYFKRNADEVGNGEAHGLEPYYENSDRVYVTDSISCE